MSWLAQVWGSLGTPGKSPGLCRLEDICPAAAVGALRGYKTHEKQSAQQIWLSSGGWHPPSGFLYLFLGTGEMYLNPPSSVWCVSGPASVGGKVETSPTHLPYSVPHLIHPVILRGKYDPHRTDEKTVLYSNESVITTRLIPLDMSPSGNVSFTYF